MGYYQLQPTFLSEQIMENLKRQIMQLKKNREISDKIVENVFERLVFIEKSTIEKNVKRKESKEVDELEIQRTITENKK